MWDQERTRCASNTAQITQVHSQYTHMRARTNTYTHASHSTKYWFYHCKCLIWHIYCSLSLICSKDRWVGIYVCFLWIYIEEKNKQIKWEKKTLRQTYTLSSWASVEVTFVPTRDTFEECKFLIQENCIYKVTSEAYINLSLKVEDKHSERLNYLLKFKPMKTTTKCKSLNLNLVF